MNDDLGESRHLILLQTTGRTTHAQAGDDASRPVVDRRPDTADAGLMLALVDGIAAGADLFQLALELAPVGYRRVGEALQSPGDDRVDLRWRWNARIALPTLVQWT